MFYMKTTFLRSASLSVVITYLTCVYYFYDTNPTSAFTAPRPGTSRKIWASMGLCFSENTQLHGKSRYPYKDVAPLALLLWRFYVPDVNLIVRIVYTEPQLSSFMTVYAAMLENTGAVVEWIPAGNMSCVLKSQLIRLFLLYVIVTIQVRVKFQRTWTCSFLLKSIFQIVCL